MSEALTIYVDPVVRCLERLAPRFLAERVVQLWRAEHELGAINQELRDGVETAWKAARVAQRERDSLEGKVDALTDEVASLHAELQELRGYAGLCERYEACETCPGRARKAGSVPAAGHPAGSPVPILEDEGAPGVGESFSS